MSPTLSKLYEIAVRELKNERYIAPLQTAELINEPWLRSLSKGAWEIRDRVISSLSQASRCGAS
jgi:hypothetical protein